ncbi:MULTISPECIES: (2Fe-2S)-binding protein [Clostridium]|uniref:(2Fe-2S)-binding protein n=1 Tax=Clostridium cibarium TaxID=2762247 RepID=A0ABR8PR84_9CLOT|nr:MULTISPECIES: (2Fe-2S)-binding protein [Clostridium]MBD7910683.1 (2Fe-2S)-binding protein [Clostridium cibarium]
MSNVCLCRGISEEKIIEAIKDGATSFIEVKEKTGAGTGGCSGLRCRNKIEMLILENK